MSKYDDEVKKLQQLQDLNLVDQLKDIEETEHTEEFATPKEAREMIERHTLEGTPWIEDIGEFVDSDETCKEAELKPDRLLSDKELFDIAEKVEIGEDVFCHILPPEVYRYRAIAKAQRDLAASILNKGHEIEKAMVVGYVTMAKDKECKARVESLIKEIEEKFETLNRPRVVPYKESESITGVMRVLDNGYWISQEDWQLLKEKELGK